MSFKVLDESENKLVGRKELRARVTYSGATPNREEVKKQIKGGNVVIRRIKPEFGEGSAIVEAVVYGSKEIMEKLEAEHIKKKNEKKEVPKEEAETPAPATEASPEEKAAEEVKEEAPAEETKKEDDA